MSSGMITLIIYLVVLVPLMLLGFYFARRKMFFPHHKMVMTSVVILNWILIGAVMVGSFSRGVVPGIPSGLSDIRIWLPLVHMILGLIAQLSATYLVILMWTERTAFEKLVPIRIKNIKTPMRATLGLWLLVVLMGFGIYATWNAPSTDTPTDAPVSTEEALDPASTEEATEAADPYAQPETSATEEAPAPESTEASG